ncbi:hypothetical protein [Actinomadura decatromicini]|nr:hypothetical protein [Actinomadura decatromicini]
MTQLSVDSGGSDSSKTSVLAMEDLAEFPTTYHFAWKQCPR